MNKYGGINDFPTCEKRVYSLWFQMLRRCYDKTQHERSKGKCYEDCEVSDRWKYLSNFAKDITKLEGYEDWRDKEGYCLDKDTKIEGNRTYGRAYCRFIPRSENIRDANRRNPNAIYKAIESAKTKYILELDGVSLLFNSETEACEFLRVKRCSVASCYRSKCKCKGYTVKRADMRGVKDE